MVALTLRCLGPPPFEAKWSFWGKFRWVTSKIFPINKTTVAQLSLKDSLGHFLMQEYSTMKKRAYQDAYDNLLAGDPRPSKNQIMAKQEKLGYRELMRNENLPEDEDSSESLQLKTRRIVMADKAHNIIINAFTLPFSQSTQAYTAGSPLEVGPRVFISRHGVQYAITICGKLTDDEISELVDWGKGKPVIHLIDKGDDHVITYKNLGFDEDIKDCDRSTHTMAQNELRKFYADRGAGQDVLESMLATATGRYQATLRDNQYGRVRVTYATDEQTTPSGVPDTLERAQYVTSAVFAAAVETITHVEYLGDFVENGFLERYSKLFKKAGYKLKGGNLQWKPIEQCTFLSCILHQSTLGTLMVPISPCKLTLMCEGLVKFERPALAVGCKPAELAMYGIAKSAGMYYRNPLGRMLLDYYIESTQHLSKGARLVAVKTYRVLTDHRYKVQEGVKRDITMDHHEYLSWLRNAYLADKGEIPPCLGTDEPYFQLVDQLASSRPAIDSEVWLAIARLHHA
jgi:hypothetical protein